MLRQFKEFALKKYFDVGVLCIAFSILFQIAFPIGPDPIIDTGRELYTPLRISEGAVLYRDIAYFNGPLSPYLNAALFNFVPFSIQNSMIVNAMIIFLISTGIWLLSTYWFGRSFAFIATLSFISIFAFQVLPFGRMHQYLTPYSHELLHGLLISIFIFLAFSFFLKSGSSTSLLTTGFLSGLLFLTKSEFYLSYLVSIPTMIWLSQYCRGISHKTSFLTLSKLFIPSLIPVLAFFIYFATHMELDKALISVLGAWPYLFTSKIETNVYYISIMGLNELSNNLLVIGKSASILAVLALATAIAHRFSKLIFVLPISFIIIFTFTKFPTYFSASFPFLIIFAALILASSILKKKIHSPSNFFLLSLGIFSFVFIGKIIFRAYVYNYGVFHTVFAYMFLLFFTWRTWSINRTARFACIFFAFSISGYYAFWSSQESTFYRYAIRYKNHYFAPEYSYISVEDALVLIDKHVPETSTLLAFPQGLLLNVLSGRIHPSRYTNFMATEFDLFGSENITRDLISAAPDFILLVHRHNRSRFKDFNPDFFNGEYAQEINKWIQNKYEEIDRSVGLDWQYILLKNMD